MGQTNTKQLAWWQKIPCGDLIVMIRLLKKIPIIIRRVLDMTEKNVYIHYSGATDVTGQKLQEALKISGGKTAPKGKKIVIGWGAKTKDAVNLGSANVLNHPDRIRDNRNKFKTLQAMKAADIKVADFVGASDVITAIDSKGPIILPVIGRTNFHQGGKGFWLCLTKHQVRDAISKGAQYFQNYIPIKDEFRLHIFGDDLLYAVKKVQRGNMSEAFKEQHGDKIKASAEKGNKDLDEDTIDYVLDKIAPRVLPDPDMIVRSNMRGWKFSHVKDVNGPLLDEAVKALKAIGLNFGAVDCCIDEENKPWIIEINSGPGLDGTPFDAYVKAFKSKIDEILNPKKVVKETTKKEVATKAPTAPTGGGSIKEKLKAKAELMNEMIASANEDEASALQNVFGKMFSGK